MAQQTKRKRRTKHRGNAAGMVETRGRTGRKLTSGERGGGSVKMTAQQRRDLRLNTPPSWRSAIIKAGIAALLFAVAVTLLFGQPILGAIGLAIFTFIGARTAYAAGAPELIVVTMGTITGAAGGVMRDVLCAEVPLILRREIYATAAIAGATVYVLLEEVGAVGPIVAALPVATVFALRLAAIRFDLHVPPFRPKDGRG